MRQVALIRIENMVDLITNSSSELFVIESKEKTAEMLAQMVNEATAGFGLGQVVTPFSFEKRIKKDSENYEVEWDIDNILENFPDSDREMLKEKYFTNGGNYFAVKFDRDWSYSNDYVVKDKLIELGFEFMGSDY